MPQLKNKVLKLIRRKNGAIGSITISVAFIYFFFTIFSNSHELFKKFNPTQAESIFSQSQWQQSQNFSEAKLLDEWAIKNGHTGWKNYMDETVSQSKISAQKTKIIRDKQNKGVSDSFLYSYVGYKYVNGTNPSLLNPEHPPLAKYLIGYSILLFGNEHLLGIGVAFFTLLLVFFISYQLYGSFLTASIALLLTGVFPLFTDQITHGPQLELYQLFFFLLVVLFMLLWEKKKKMAYCIVAGIFFGFLLSTKTLLPFLILFSVWLLTVLWKKWKELIIIFSCAAFTFCLTYYAFFIQGGTIKSFLGLQKYIVLFYGNAHIPLIEFAGNYLRLIATGSWKFWDTARTVSFYSEWNILWPILFFIGILRLKKRWVKNKNVRFLIVFFILYNAFVYVVPIFPRYLLLLFVPLIIVL